MGPNKGHNVSRENVQWYRGQLPAGTELVDREAHVSTYEFIDHSLTLKRNYYIDRKC